MLLKRAKQTARKRFAAMPEFLGRQERLLTVDQLTKSGLLKIGRHTYGTPKIWMYRGSETRIEIGSYCSISPGVEIIGGGIHPVDWVSTFPLRARWHLDGAEQDGMPSTKGDIRIGNDVWIGTGATILSGVTIGDGAIVASRALVTKDVRPYAIVGGIPATEIRRRFNDDEVEQLLKIAWWTWRDESVLAAVDLLSSKNIAAFLERYGERDE